MAVLDYSWTVLQIREFVSRLWTVQQNQLVALGRVVRLLQKDGPSHFTGVLSNPAFARLQLLLEQHRQKRPTSSESSRNQLRMLAMLRWHWCLFLVWIATLSPVISQEEDEMPDDQDIAEEAMSPEQLRALHAKFDQNGDGKVSLSEVLDFARHMSKVIAGKDVSAILEEIDTDKDGNLPELGCSMLYHYRPQGLRVLVCEMRGCAH